MSIARIWAIAANAFREVIRDRILYFTGFFAIILIIALQILPPISTGNNIDEKIFLDFGLGAMGFLSAILAIFVGVSLINKEIEKKTVLILIPKPITRAEFILGKHLGLSGVLLILVLIMTGIYLFLLAISGIVYPLKEIMVSLLYLYLELGLLIAVAMVFSVFTSSILATLFSFGIYLMGHLSRELVELGQISENENIILFTKSLYLILPDLERLNLRNEAVYGLLPSSGELLTHGLYGLLYISVLLSLTILIFSQREF